MAWEQPKTDWYGATVNGVYSGDKFNATDFNRIKNNLVYLNELANTLYSTFVIDDVGDDKTYTSYLYASEINKLEANLETINVNTVSQDYGETVTYCANGNTMDYTELNRLESATLDIYNKLNNQADGRRMFEWNLGMGVDF